MPRSSRLLVARAIVASVIAGAPLLATPWQDRPLAPNDLDFFEKKIRPLLAERCYECHDASRGAPKGGLALNHRDGWEQGGDSGPAVVPGDVEKSLLLVAIRATSEAPLRMPPSGRLADDEVALFEEWVRMGAPDPREATAETRRATIDWEAARSFWAYRPLDDAPLPPVTDESRVHNPIDRFVLARLDATDLQLAPAADRRTWIRRVSFDLTGLPPTPNEIESFLADDTPQGYERVVDRLLNSPAYGERWARMWLDVARYADSNGLDENLAYGNAWRYRDWVVKAFDRDLPYNDFVVAQIAGDLVEGKSEEETFDNWTATGFLCLGPKMLAEQDKEKLVMDVVDEQLDVLGRAFLGQTIGCARCHDHKFDPIPTRDYYALAGILKSTSTFSELGHVSRWRERELATADAQAAKKEHQAQLTTATTARDRIRADANRILMDASRERLADYLVAGEAAAREALFVEAEDYSRGNLNRDDKQWGSRESVVVHTIAAGQQHVEYDVARQRGEWMELSVRYASAEARPMRLLVNGEVVSSDVLGGISGEFRATGQRWERVTTIELRPGRNVIRFDRMGAVPHIDKLLLVPMGHSSNRAAASAWPLVTRSSVGLVPNVVRAWADFLVRSARANEPLFAPWRDVAQIVAPTGDDFACDAAIALARFEKKQGNEPRREEVDASPPITTLLTTGVAPRSLAEFAERYQSLFAEVGRTLPEIDATPSASDPPPDADRLRARFVLRDAEGPFGVSSADGSMEAHYPVAIRERLAILHEEVQALEGTPPPMFPSVLAVIDASQTADIPVHVRGSHLNLDSQTVPRGALTLLDEVVVPPTIATNGSGRLELARWIVDPNNPLTSRVMVNRLWSAMFGRGIVDQPSYFGRRTTPPSHPELLDWLARDFVDGGWSVRRTLRTIALSATYRAASEPSADALHVDPTNRLLSHQTRRRLSAEAVRDALLATSGRLDVTRGGTLLGTRNRDYVTNDQSNDQARYSEPRRSLYLPIVRNAMYGFFAAFDYNDPSIPVDVRPTTTVPTQALYLLNSPLWIEQSERFAERLLAQPDLIDDAGRVGHAYLVAFGRDPHRDEVQLALDYLDRHAPSVESGDAPLRGTSAAPSTHTLLPRENPRFQAWCEICQVLLASNEFLTID